VKQFQITNRHLYRDFEEIHESPVSCLAPTPDQGSLFTADSLQNLKQKDLKTGSLLNNFGDVFEIKIRALQMTPDESNLYNSGLGQVSKFDLQDGKFFEKGFAVNSGVFCMVISNNG
jgi:WD40 repeat protein